MVDNMSQTTQMSEQQMSPLAEEAKEFIVDYMDVLFGPAYATKAHRVADHLLSALLDNGNLWEGETSKNEALQVPCKRMYSRTNKPGPTVVLQMMRAAETQCEVLREIQDLEDEEADGDDWLFRLLEDKADDGDVTMAPTPTLSRSRSGLRMLLGGAEQLPGMTGLGSLRSKDANCSLVVSLSFNFYCSFELRAETVVETACASDAYLGKPRYDQVWYSDVCGQQRVGWVRLIVRMLDGVAENVHRGAAHTEGALAARLPAHAVGLQEAGVVLR